MLKQLIARQMVKRTKSRQFPVDYLEQKHVDQAQPYPNDSSYFYGGDKQGNAFITRMAFREPKRANEYWFDFFLKDHGYFGLTSSPGPEGVGFQQGTLKWEAIETGKIWRVTFEGTVHDRGGKPHRCITNLVFTGDHPVYDFAKSSDHTAIASAIAAEKWTKQFFHAMKDTHQVHYEQTGRIKGSIILDGKTIQLDMTGSRDHSFGSRNWLTWDRHYWITGVSDAGIHWTVTTIKWQFLGRLTAGFITAADGTTDAIVACTDLETVSKEQLLPDHGIVDIKTRAGKTHRMEFWRHGEFPYLHDGKYMMREGIGTYKFDGVDGVGMVEFGFHSDKYKGI
ncbi:MAG: hypothetical protein NT040_16945 [Bacteroidetes bacterium]|nr:hypothetical protein [Bacteroidota bacterium]